jgi:hypothetical protein
VCSTIQIASVVTLSQITMNNRAGWWYNSGSVTCTLQVYLSSFSVSSSHSLLTFYTVKLSLGLIKHHAVKTYGGVDV